MAAPVSEKRRGSTVPSSDFAGQLLELYQEYNPTKISDIPALLVHWQGKEVHLLEQLHIKYAGAHESSGTAHIVDFVKDHDHPVHRLSAAPAPAPAPAPAVEEVPVSAHSTAAAEKDVQLEKQRLRILQLEADLQVRVCVYVCMSLLVFSCASLSYTH